MLRGSSLGDLDETRRAAVRPEDRRSRIYPEMRELVRAHMARGHTVVLSSSALTVQVEPVARFLGIENMLSNKFEIDDDGVLTGEVLRPIIWGPGKANAVQEFAADNDIDLSKSYFYADGDEDVALMYLVGNPRPTNPGGQDGRGRAPSAAGRSCEFSSRSGSGSWCAGAHLARRRHRWCPLRLGAIGLGPADPQPAPRRQLLHHRVPELLLAANGVNLNVLGRGEPHREAAGGVHLQPPQPLRPDHRGQRWSRTTGPGSARRNSRATRSSAHWASWSTPSFIDRDDPKSAVESLQKVEELAAQGPVHPDRAGGHPAGHPRRRPVQEGAVPARDGRRRPDRADRDPQRRGDRAAGLLHDAIPGTVDVVVYPPISVADWTLDDLPERIAEVRQLYLDTLKDWPRRARFRRSGCTRSAVPRRRPAKKAPPRRLPPRRRRAKKAPAKKAAAKKTAGQEDRPKTATDCQGPTMTAADHLADFSTTDDALVLASVSSKAEFELLNDWLQRPAPRAPRHQGRGAASCRTGTRRREWWPSSSRNSKPARTARWCRCGCSGCPADCPPGSRSSV